MSSFSIVSFNVRGINRAAKRRWIGSFLGSIRPACVVLLETKLSFCND